MDIRLGIDLRDPIAYIFSHPEKEIVYINSLAFWPEVMEIAPMYDRYKGVSITIEDFMVGALGWEGLILTVFRSQGGHVSMSLDKACASQGFHDMFLDVHH